MPLTCDHCYSFFNAESRLPKKLPCEHVACLECIVKASSSGGSPCTTSRSPKCEAAAPVSPELLPDLAGVLSAIRITGVSGMMCKIHS